MNETLFDIPYGVLSGQMRSDAEETIRRYHYTHAIPSGKSHYVKFHDAIVVWSIPANGNIAMFLFGEPLNVWELSRLWAPDNHANNLLTQSISYAVRVLKKIEKPDALVSYADPNAGHLGGVYKAASWIHHGTSDVTRMYVRGNEKVSRRSFHSGSKGLIKSQVEAMGWTEIYDKGKERFVRLLSNRAKRLFREAT
jgi:hypothetical protein